MKNHVPYTYHLYWSSTGMHYYGVRWAKNCHPNDLWVTYFTSSEKVKKYVAEHGIPDIREIRRIFCSEEIAREWEFRVLVKIKASLREDYLNKSNGGRKFFSDLLGQKNPMYGVDRSGDKNTFFGKKHSVESNTKNRIAHLGHSYNKGIPKTEKTKQKMAIGARKRAKKYRFEHSIFGNFEGSLLDLHEAFVDQNLRTDCLWQLAVGNLKTYKKWRIMFCFIDL
jgi:hypothetical protein